MRPRSKTKIPKFLSCVFLFLGGHYSGKCNKFGTFLSRLFFFALSMKEIKGQTKSIALETYETKNAGMNKKYLMRPSLLWPRFKVLVWRACSPFTRPNSDIKVKKRRLDTLWRTLPQCVANDSLHLINVGFALGFKLVFGIYIRYSNDIRDLGPGLLELRSRKCEPPELWSTFF